MLISWYVGEIIISLTRHCVFIKLYFFFSFFFFFSHYTILLSVLTDAPAIYIFKWTTTLYLNHYNRTTSNDIDWYAGITPAVRLSPTLYLFIISRSTPASLSHALHNTCVRLRWHVFVNYYLRVVNYTGIKMFHSRPFVCLCPPWVIRPPPYNTCNGANKGGLDHLKLLKALFKNKFRKR